MAKWGFPRLEGFLGPLKPALGFDIPISSAGQWTRTRPGAPPRASPPEPLVQGAVPQIPASELLPLCLPHLLLRTRTPGSSPVRVFLSLNPRSFWGGGRDGVAGARLKTTGPDAKEMPILQAKPAQVLRGSKSLLLPS